MRKRGEVERGDGEAEMKRGIHGKKRGIWNRDESNQETLIQNWMDGEMDRQMDRQRDRSICLTSEVS